LIVFDAVAALAKVVVKFPEAGNIDSVPAVPERPSVGVTVQEDAVVLDVLGTDPADGAEVAFVPPPAIAAVPKIGVADAP